MDKVRLGRALGYGARHAARAMVSAVDAATSPDPTPAAQPARPPVPLSARAAAAKTHAPALGHSVWKPVKKFSSVVWLQVTGAFFAIFALTMGGAVWHHRHDFHPPLTNPESQKALAFAVLFLVFLWFAVSNFLRAARRDRQT